MCLHPSPASGASSSPPVAAAEPPQAAETGMGDTLPDTIPGSPELVVSTPPPEPQPVQDVAESQDGDRNLEESKEPVPEDPPMVPSTCEGPTVPTVGLPAVAEPTRENPPSVPATAAAAGGTSSGGGTKRPGGPLDVDDLEIHVNSVPPQPLSDKAIYMRLKRVFTKQRDGSFILDDRWNQAWSDINGGGRAQLYGMFEKVGYERDWFHETPMSTH